jgi:hypothetical protein
VTAYDDSILQQYAYALYREAKWVAFWMAVTFGGITFLISAVVIGAISLLPQTTINGNDDTQNVRIMVVVVLSALGAFVGLGIGRQKAFRLKLQAQQILCQRQIEINTRTGP